MLLIMMVSLLGIMSGCSAGSHETSQNTNQASNTPQTQEANQVRQISIGGAGTAGTFYIIASGIADLINRELGINSVAEVTAGSVENNKLIGAGKIEMAVTQVDVALNALAGENEFDQPVKLTAIAPLYPNVIQVVTLADSSIETFRDLKGKKVSVGSPGSGVLATNEVILNTLGLTLDDIEPQYLSFAETTNAFRDGTIDAAIVNTAAPAPWVVDLETTHPVKVIPFTEEEINTFSSKFPYYVPATIPKDSYQSLQADVPTFAVWITLVSHADLPEDTVYDVVKTIFDHQETLKNVHVAASYITLENVQHIKGIPFHPGAIKYYQEQGITVQ